MSREGEGSAHDRAFRFLLRLMPGDFRSGYARDMEATFRSQRREAGGGFELLLLWLATVPSLLRAALVEHSDLFLRDARFAARSMARSPWHAGTAVATLGLGLGASLALFSVVDAVLLAPLPYSDSARLVSVAEVGGNGDPGRSGYLTFLDLRQRARSFSGLIAGTNTSVTLGGDGKDAERVNGMRVSAGYFETFGLRPRFGRGFQGAEDRPGSARQVTVLGDALWRRRYGADPAIVGRPVEIGGTPFVVVGVLPPLRDDLVAERLFGGAELYTPLGYDPAASYACRTCRHLELLGRLAPGATTESATRELDSLLSGLATEHEAEYHHPSSRVVTLAEVWLGPARPVLLALAGGVLLLLLSACAHVSNLLLLRAGERAHEIAVRAALGVTRGRLARQLVTESLLLALAGGLAGLLPAAAVLRLAAVHGAGQMPRLAEASLDARAVAAGLGLVVCCALGFGLAPIASLLKKEGGQSLGASFRVTGDRLAWRARAALVAANVFVAVVLVVGSGLLAKSLRGLLAVEPGFDPRGVLTADLHVNGTAYRTADQAANIAAAVRFYDAVLERVRGLPGVKSAAAVTTLPLGGGVDGYGLHVVGRPLANPEQAPSADRFVVTPGFFETLRVPLVRGRLLDARDAQGALPVAVVNRRVAREIFPGQDAIGQKLALGPPDAPPRTIVGIVEDVRHHGLDTPPGYQVYLPQAQWAWAETTLTLVLRAEADPASLAAPLRRLVRELDPSQALGRVARYPEVIAATTGTRRFATLLLGLFAGSALLLSIVGVYGALGVVVSRRRREIGVRLALGARASAIRRMVVVQGLRPVAAGLIAGILASALATRLLRSLLYRVEPLDPATFALSAAALLLCGCLACQLPASRAARTDPAVALRTE